MFCHVWRFPWRIIIESLKWLMIDQLIVDSFTCCKEQLTLAPAQRSRLILFCFLIWFQWRWTLCNSRWAAVTAVTDHTIHFLLSDLILNSFWTPNQKIKKHKLCYNIALLWCFQIMWVWWHIADDQSVKFQLFEFSYINLMEEAPSVQAAAYTIAEPISWSLSGVGCRGRTYLSPAAASCHHSQFVLKVFQVCWSLILIYSC